MKNVRMWTATLGVVFVLSLPFWLPGCTNDQNAQPAQATTPPPPPATDPIKEDLKKGENIDLERMEGEITDIGVKYFKGDRKGVTDEKTGKPCYWIRITHKDGHQEEVVGISTTVFDAVVDHLKDTNKLPIPRTLTLSELAGIEGLIVDKCWAPPNKFYLLIQQGSKLTSFRVCADAFADERVRKGEHLPLK
jgi:hypothetical protein